jgi:hypothetical protein
MIRQTIKTISDMKKLILLIAFITLSVSSGFAQFEKGKWYVNASLTGLDLSHSKYEGTKFGINIGGGTFIDDNIALIVNFKGDYLEHGMDESSIGAQGRYYFSSCGIYGGLGMAYKHLSNGDLKKT